MDAAQRNGYVDKDGEAEARRAIRSGFRNGLHHPRALPDFTASGPRPGRPGNQPPPADCPASAEPGATRARSTGTPQPEASAHRNPPGDRAAGQAASTTPPREHQDAGD